MMCPAKPTEPSMQVNPRVNYGLHLKNCIWRAEEGVQQLQYLLLLLEDLSLVPQKMNQLAVSPWYYRALSSFIFLRVALTTSKTS